MGDFDGTGNISLGDLNLVLFNWGQPGATLPESWMNNRPTGNVGITELDNVLFNWGNTAVLASVPEPNCLVLVWIAVAYLVRWRSKV